MQKLVVTGATSMIGLALIEEILRHTEIERIYAVIRPNSKKITRLPNDSRIRIISCDIAEYENLPKLINDKCDIFYHFAWPRTATYTESFEDILSKCDALKYTLTAVKAAVEIRCVKFLGAGGYAEYGLSEVKEFSPDTPCYPVRADGIAHLAAGQLAGLLSKKYDIQFVWVRIFSIYGKYDRTNSMISSTIENLMQGKHCSFTVCTQKWDYLAAEDAGRAFYLLGISPKSEGVYCLGSGAARSLRDYINTIRDIVAPEAKLGFGELPYPNNPVIHMCADISKLSHDTGWEPQIDFHEGIKEIYDFRLKEGSNIE